MTPFDRRVRARIYALLAGGAPLVNVATVAEDADLGHDDVAASFRRLAEEHRIAVRDDLVWMAHPFSGVPTGYRAVIGDRSWYANCAWDALAILSLVGDGAAHGPDGPLWRVDDGVVESDGLIRLLVPARDFWDDIGFT